MKILLAADVGGTKVNLSAFELETDKVLAEGYYLCANYTSLTALVKDFLVQLEGVEIEAACFGLPAPIQGRKVPLTNLHWVVDADEIEAECDIKKLILINDFSAAAYGIEVLQPEDCIELQKNTYSPLEQAQGNRLVIGAGTGLGMSLMVQCHGSYIPHASEGGHIDFAPVNKEQEHLLGWLHQKWQHVSYERLLSGEGIKTLYKFYSTQTQGAGDRHTPSAPQISFFAHQGDPIAIRT
jgi:glucokinase